MGPSVPTIRHTGHKLGLGLRLQVGEGKCGVTDSRQKFSTMTFSL